MTDNPMPIPTGTMTRAQIETAARDIRHHWDRDFMPTRDQMRTAITNYCDDPAINSTDRSRIMVRLEQML